MEDWEYKVCLQAAATGRAQQDHRVLGKLVAPKSAADVQPLLQQTKALLGKVSTHQLMMLVPAEAHSSRLVLGTGAPTVMASGVDCFVSCSS